MLDKNTKDWFQRMVADTEAYEKNRAKNKKSPTEKENWPKGGWHAIRKAANDFIKRNRFAIHNGDPSLKKLYLYQTYIVLRLFSEIPFRNGFADFHLTDVSGKNYVSVPKKGSIQFVVREHKNVKSMGEKKIKVSRGGTTQLRKFLKFRAEVVDNKNDHFLNTLKGTKMTRSALGKMLQRTLRKLLNKNIGSRLIRVLAATENRDSIEKVSKLSDSLLHTTKQSKEYVRKD